MSIEGSRSSSGRWVRRLHTTLHIRSLSLVRRGPRQTRHHLEPDPDIRHGRPQWHREGLPSGSSLVDCRPPTKLPLTRAQGLYLAVDLGGTNFRVCSIHLNGDTTFALTQSKVAIPRELMVATDPAELFGFLAAQIEKFLQTHHTEHFETTRRRRRTASGDSGYRDEEIFQLGFTFSFPVDQRGINSGTLIRWTKGFDIRAAVGQDVCALLQKEIDTRGLPVRVAALVNDTVGTLMARAYTSPGKARALLGAIFGTGTNGAYVERRARVTKMDQGAANGAGAGGADTAEMIINCEWGSFDNGLAVLPDTAFDRALDAESNNPGVQMFEKRVSGTVPPSPSFPSPPTPRWSHTRQACSSARSCGARSSRSSTPPASSATYPPAPTSCTRPRPSPTTPPCINSGASTPASSAW